MQRKNSQVSSSVILSQIFAVDFLLENLVEYVTVMLCVTIDKQPIIGMIYSPFTRKFGWGYLSCWFRLGLVWC